MIATLSLSCSRATGQTWSKLRQCLPTHLSAQYQHGQAFTEALVVLIVLLTLFTAVAWLGRYQDIALQASHASRYVAFDHARGQAVDASIIRSRFFMQPNHQWTDRAGNRLFDKDQQQVSVELAQLEPLSDYAQPGQTAEHAHTLRQDWQLADAGVRDARVGLQFIASLPGLPQSATFMSGLRHFDQAYPTLHRHTSILIGAGHASNDDDAQARVAHAASAWSDVAQASYRLRGQIYSTMHGIDAAWNRPEPTDDWLAPWAGDIPHHHRHNFGERP